MKIINIFAQRLFAFHYDDEVYNEYDRLMNLWDDIVYLYRFTSVNINDLPKGKSIQEIVEQLIEDAYEIDETLLEITENEEKTLSYFFKRF